MKNQHFNRRTFLQRGLTLAAGLPVALKSAGDRLVRAESSSAASVVSREGSKVAIVACKDYGPAVRQALSQSFDLIGGIGSLVKNKTVTVKLNLTGTDFTPFLNRPVG